MCIAACGKINTHNSIELVTKLETQDSLFRNLMLVSNNTVPDNKTKDSLAFLILPIQASCPSCRNKTIDSIARHEHDLRDGHYIILSASVGRKNIGGYFIERNSQLPYMPQQLILDTTNQTYKLELVDDKPTIYYSFNSKVYKKVSAIPSTVKDDLREFFSSFCKKGD